MSDAFLARLAGALAHDRAGDALRTLEVCEPAPRARVRLAGRELVNFSGNDYLGLAAHPYVLARVRETLGNTGFGAGAAALLSGRSALHDELERRVATLTGHEAGLLFSSGYLANLGALAALAGREDAIAHDRLNHASLIDGVIASRARHRRYRHGTLPDLDALPPARQRFVVTESVFSMDGDAAPLAELAAVAEAGDAVLYVDDAHGFGVTGDDGRGAAAALAAVTAPPVTLTMITLGKALGSAGALVLGPAVVIDTLVQRARTFVYDTAAPPVTAAAALAALDLAFGDSSPRHALTANVAHFRAQARAAGLPLLPSTTAIQPLPIGADGDALRAAAALNAAGYYVRAIRPPTVPRGTARLRITLSASHDRADIDGLVAACAEAVTG